MASQLIGLMRRLVWNDFKEVRKPEPGPGQVLPAAETNADVSYSRYSLNPIPGGAPARLRLEDNITVRIVFNAAKSWRANWMKTKPKIDQDRLLQHEQGHYNISALIARDFFLDFMQLKKQRLRSLGRLSA